jgi:hypothetical protein
MSEHSGPIPLTLYGGANCHLCELAEQVVEACRQRWPGLSCAKVDVATDPALFQRYGMRIPVLRFADGRELGWPFTAEALAELIETPVAVPDNAG